MATALDHIKSALRMTHYLQSGETPTAGEQTDALAIANRMLDSWNADGLTIFSVQRTTHTLIASTNPHTMGSGGNINTDRPVKIERAGIIIAGQTAETAVEVLTSMDEYAKLINKSATGSVPFKLFYDPAFALGKIYLYPLPDAANTLVLYRWTPLSSIATVGTTVSFPPGYEEAFVSNLAIRLAAENFGIVRGDLATVARDSLPVIKRLNVRVPILSPDYFSGSKYGGGEGGNIFTRKP